MQYQYNIVHICQGQGAPPDVHPFKLRSGTCRRYAQRFPSMSQEGKANGSEREQILNDLEPLILEVIRAVSMCLHATSMTLLSIC